MSQEQQNQSVDTSNNSQIQYLRFCTLILTDKKGNGIDLSNFRIVFSVKKSDAQTPNTASIRVYNLSQDTANEVKKEFQVISLQAGYTGNYGVIFHGNITQIIFGRENGTESFVDFTCGDGDQAYNYAIVNKTLSAGASQTDQINAATQDMKSKGIITGYLSSATNTVKLTRGKVMFGMSRDYLRQSAQSSGTGWSVQDGKLQFIKRTEVLPNQAVVLTSKTGLIGTPEQTNDGIKVQCLLNPTIKVGGKIQLAQDSIAAAKLDNTQKNDQVNKPSPINPDGFYRVLTVEYVGDSRGNDWFCNIVSLDVDATALSTNQVQAL